MAARPSVDVPAWLDDQLAQASPDLLRAMLTTYVEALLSADADTACGATYGERSPDRVNRRNGYRDRDWDTRVGTIEVAIPSCARAATSRSGC
jgi:putative transposase